MVAVTGPASRAGVNGHDVPGVIAFDSIDAYEGDWFAVAAFPSAGLLYGGRLQLINTLSSVRQWSHSRP